MALNKITPGDVTLTMAGTRHPRTLLEYLTVKRKFTVNENHPGIYTVEGEAFPIQIIESKKLSDDENIWLKNLKKNINAEDLDKVIRISREKYDNISLSAYLFALIAANPEIFKEVIKKKGADKMGKPSLTQVLEELGWTKEWEERGEARGEARGILRSAEETALKMLKKGYMQNEIIELTGVNDEWLKKLQV
jgi:hypothetical protein